MSDDYEIEITPAMIEAGAGFLLDYFSGDGESVVDLEPDAARFVARNVISATIRQLQPAA